MDWATHAPINTPAISDLELPDNPFIALWMADARHVPSEVVSSAIEHLLNRGMSMLCAWGPDCERVHDIADEILVAGGLSSESDLDVMTTWHDQETLEEAVEFTLLNAPGLAGTDCTAIIVVGEPNWEPRVRAAAERCT